MNSMRVILSVEGLAKSFGALAVTDGVSFQVREGEILTCPWHGLEFDLTTGRCLANPRVRVRQYPVAVEDGLVKLLL